MDRPVGSDSSSSPGGRAPLAGIWLAGEAVQTSVESLLLAMLTPNLLTPALCAAEVEELQRGAKLVAVALEYLGLRLVDVDTEGEVPLQVVAPAAPRDPWWEALVVPGGDRPLGLLINTADAGPLVLVHEVYQRLGAAEKSLVRRYAALALRGSTHERIVTALRSDDGYDEFVQTLNRARRAVQLLDPTVLWSPDGATRVQLGSLSQTMKDILREGPQGDFLFILPANLFEGRTNYGDVEFLIYLNFFFRQQKRTRVAGTARQRHILHRLLTLTLFGLFDPAQPTPPSFETLRAAYGVESRETYEFLVAAYEAYVVRRGDDPRNPPLAADDYVDFVTLDEAVTTIALPSATVAVTRHGRAFDVRIVQPDGSAAEKRLEVGRLPRLVRAVPEHLRGAIQFASERPRFGVTPLGTSHGFDPNGDFTTLIIWINSRGILVDPSPEALAYLEQIGVAPSDVPYVFLTHVHADHDGGLIEKLLSGSRTTVIASDPVFRAFAEKAQLVTGHDFERAGLVRHVSANPDSRVRIEVAGEFAELETRWNLHPIPTNGLKVTVGGRTFGYSGDTQFDPALLQRLRAEGKLSPAHFADLMYFFWTPDGEPTVDVLYHEAGLWPIHTEQGKLRALPPAVLDRTFLVHIADEDVPEGSILAKPPLFETQTLLAPTPRSREQLLLETMRLVAYLYDMPDETLLTLLRASEVVTFAQNEVIVTKGPIGKNEPLHFQIVTEGRVSVRDGRRVIATLVKADTFGEWGISHQRGFRAADVVAERPSQALRLGEAQYHWLVGKHPVIQDRISRIRTLLPRLQLAQERAWLKAEAGSRERSVIEHMTSSQLSSFAIFGKVQTFKRGQHIVVQGDEADGVYVLLSGHLTVDIEGRLIGEVSEGDVFGELGLLEGGTREANVTVVSADAEVLFMSSRSFQHLLQTVPAFAWGIWETAATRRESIRHPTRTTP